MSGQKQKDRNSPKSEQVVPDAIFKRMEDPVTIICNDCKQKIPNRDDIKNHYDRDHPSTTLCVYCHEKKFTYTYKSGSNKPQEASYHRCNYTHENEKE